MSFKKPTQDEIINAVESALEGDNRHSESFAPKWEAIKKFIQPKDRIKAIKALADTFDCSWETDLQYTCQDQFDNQE